MSWQPDGGRAWSIAQCLDHLARANTEYLRPMGEALRRARERGRLRRGPVPPGFLGAWFIRQLEPPPRRGMRAPRAIVPSSALPAAEALRLFPLVRGLRFRTAAGFRIVAAHDRRHLWQARRVLESPGFPAR